MSDKLKMAHADRISDARRDAVLAAAIDFANAKPQTLTELEERTIALRKVVQDYQAFAPAIGGHLRACAVISCGAPEVCKRHAHCFYRDNASD
ncbi:hypothetical protein [Bradyrhizobium sp. Ec3.3]|uniref:hypothetical protein n=1 Tax=Bradyrhizobium sp. Ec3.3 TaxID=189753 RepID=UPI000420171B|nr:hypothetical protein [Bradyrhizobium sp. Ec3.3]